MNRILTAAILAAALAIGTATAHAAYDAKAPLPSREHRAVWLSPMLNYTWPRAVLKTSNAEARKKDLVNDIAKLKRQGINVIYFHVRSNSDAFYFSEYEPMPSNVAGTRGGTTPFDPFEYFVETAHAAGIEVYAWVNPYRYSNNGLYGNTSELNYEVSHPEWLIISGKQSILNPGIPEVQQRVADVVSEIATKFDIDGVLFDDYFYLNSMSAALDADTYQKYKTGDISQAAWRRQNVNNVVRMCREATLAARPYAVFAMGPAGRISPPNIETYGLEPGPYGDMNYNELHADPIGWLNEGWLDFLSPQVYWHSYFDRLTEWYSTAVPHFGRHLYTSVDCSRLSEADANEYLRQIDYMRTHLRPNESGVVFFDYGAYNNYREKYDGSTMAFGDILSGSLFCEPTLQPMHPWRAVYTPATVSNVHREGNTLVWNAPADKRHQRYSVYAVPENERATFAGQRKYLQSVRYDNSYDITPEAGIVYAVSVYDRYGYEYAPLFEGAAAGTVAAPTSLWPAGGEKPTPIFDFKWEAAPGRYIVEVSDDNFATVLNMVESYVPTIESTSVYDFKEGKEYSWRVRVLSPNGSEAVSAPVSFSADGLSITYPAEGAAGISYEPAIAWSVAGRDAEYTLEISLKRDFTTLEYSGSSTSTGITVPAKTLCSGKTYYARVTAVRGRATVSSPIRTFTTVDRTDYTAPAILNPSAEGQTLHSNETLEIEPWEGMSSVAVQVSASSSFPTRSGTLTITHNKFATTSLPLGELKITGQLLKDGTTYYVRTRGAYSLSSSAGTSYTDYGPVRTFVYSATAGAGAPDAENPAAIHMDGNILVNPGNCAVTVYDTAGRQVAFTTMSNADMSHLQPGVYIIKSDNLNIQPLKWVKK